MASCIKIEEELAPGARTSLFDLAGSACLTALTILNLLAPGLMKVELAV